jgi:hypothetical protein
MSSAIDIDGQRPVTIYRDAAKRNPPTSTGFSMAERRRELAELEVKMDGVERELWWVRRNRWLLVVALAAVLLRVAWALLMMDRQPYADERAYVAHAQQILRGAGFVDASGRPAS